MKKGVLISGCSGKMGRSIIELLKDSKILEYKTGFTNNPSLEHETADLNTVKASEISIIIDFSLPEAFDSVLAWALENNKALLSGTTGLTGEQLKKAKAAGDKIPVLLSSNTSIGINFLDAITEKLATLTGFDVQMIEAHHIHKKDAPSGTAKLLQTSLETHMDKKLPPVLSVRGGGIFGEHEIMFMSEDEIISVKHTALNRKVFAAGAIRGAEWLVNKSAGFYKMAGVFE